MAGVVCFLNQSALKLFFFFFLVHCHIKVTWKKTIAGDSIKLVSNSAY